MSPTRLLSLLLVLALAAAAWSLAGASSVATVPRDEALRHGVATRTRGGDVDAGASTTASGARDVTRVEMAAPRDARVAFTVQGSATVTAAWGGSTLTATAQGEILARSEGQQLAFEVPGSVATVTFSAVGYRDVDRDVPLGDGPIDFGTIALDPDALLVVRLSPSSNLVSTTFACAVHTRQRDGVVLATATGSGTLELSVPADTNLALLAQVPRTGGPPVHLAPLLLLLRSGERREVTLSCEPVTNARLTGMSSSLLEHVQVAIEAADPADRVMPLMVRPDASGRIRFAMAGTTCRARVRVVEGDDVVLVRPDGGVDLTSGAGDVALVPAVPIIALVVTRAGRALPSRLPSRSQRYENPIAPGHVLVREYAVNNLATVWVEPLGHLQVPRDIAMSRSDVWFVDADAATRLGGLSVSIAYQPGSTIHCEAEPVGGGPPTQLTGHLWDLKALLPAGEYQLFFRVGNDERRVAAEHVKVVAGSWTTVSTPSLPRERWRVRLQAPSATPGSPMLFVSLQGVESQSADDTGEWSVALLHPPRRDDPCNLAVHPNVATFAARIVAIDDVAQLIEIDSEFTSAQWTTLVVTATPDAWGLPTILLADSRGDSQEIRDHRLAVPLLPGSTRDGGIVEWLEKAPYVTRWFRIEAGTPELTLAAQGRWRPLRIECPFDTARISVRGPSPMAPVHVRTLDGQRDTRIFVADGTQEIVVDLTPGGRRTFAGNAATFTVR